MGNWQLHQRRESFTLSDGLGQVLSFDLEGRPVTWFRQGTLYKRSLASRWLARQRVNGERHRWSLSEPQAQELVMDWLSQVRQAQETQPSPLLERALIWTPQRLAGEERRYAAAYAPVSILPPDQYYAVVVQVTRGCSWNRCTFCTFYRDRPFEVQSLTAFQAHLRAVQDLLGQAERMRRRLFLADGNALMVANSKLLPLIHAAQSAFPERALYGFLDVFTGTRKAVQDWQELHAHGLRRVYLGLETGHDPLLAWLHKPGSTEQARQLVADLKSAGLNVGVIFMTGVGGKQWAEAHVQDTLRLLRQLPLDTDDLVYFSPFVEHGEYATLARQGGVQPLSNAEIEQQEDLFRSALREDHPTVRAARYDIREFIY